LVEAAQRGRDVLRAFRPSFPYRFRNVEHREQRFPPPARERASGTPIQRQAREEFRMIGKEHRVGVRPDNFTGRPRGIPGVLLE
jgi:hypothetical protein